MTTPSFDAQSLPNHVAQSKQSYQKSVEQVVSILQFHRDAQIHGVQAYANRAPKALTKDLHSQIKAFNSACDALESQLMLARAILERDSRKAHGLSPLSVQNQAADTPGSVAQTKTPIIVDVDITKMAQNLASEVADIPSSAVEMSKDLDEELFGSDGEDEIQEKEREGSVVDAQALFTAPPVDPAMMGADINDLLAMLPSNGDGSSNFAFTGALDVNALLNFAPPLDPQPNQQSSLDMGAIDVNSMDIDFDSIFSNTG